ncbi:MAG: hypothetical protein OXM03_02015 [Chloroflexota bacterium]|nr:hypothetical protein [Chloroflexota bacterium]MDE2839383.1 hypothetical protein [Chloroflexota bacterium]MDE2931514.1 hypothetical protein [Chloroflexota bacterium]
MEVVAGIDVVQAIDVGKAQLDISVASGRARSFANSAIGTTALVRWLQREGVTASLWERNVHEKTQELATATA